MNRATPTRLGANCCTTAANGNNALRRWLGTGGYSGCLASCQAEPSCMGFDVGAAQLCNMYSVVDPAGQRVWGGGRIDGPEDLVLASSSWCAAHGFECYVVKATPPPSPTAPVDVYLASPREDLCGAAAGMDPSVGYITSEAGCAAAAAELYPDAHYAGASTLQGPGEPGHCFHFAGQVVWNDLGGATGHASGGNTQLCKRSV